MRSVGLDLGSRKTAFCVVVDGVVVERGTVKRIEELERLLGPGTAPATIAIEACREAWHIHTTLTDWGQTVLLVDTTRVKQLGIGQHGRKNDRIDAEVLARGVELGQIPRAHLLSQPRQELRQHLGIRRSLVESRAQTVTMVRGLMRSEGCPLPSCDTENFVALVKNRKLPDRLQLTVAPSIAVLETLQAQLSVVDGTLESLCAKEPAIERLTTAPGVGLIVAAMFVSVIDDAKRFRNAHQVESYLGLVPSEDSSGRRGQRLGGISKHGNSYARSLLVQAAWVVLKRKGSDDPLVVWGKEVVKRRGKQIGVVAVARRLTGILWAMWARETIYDPAHLATRSAAGLAIVAQSAELRAAAMKKTAAKARERSRVARKRTESITPPPARRSARMSAPLRPPQDVARRRPRTRMPRVTKTAVAEHDVPVRHLRTRAHDSDAGPVVDKMVPPRHLRIPHCPPTFAPSWAVRRERRVD